MSNYQHVENVENFQKTLENSKSQGKVVCYHLENEFSAFSTLDVLSNEFSAHQLDMLTLHVDVNLHSTLPTLVKPPRKYPLYDQYL